MRASDPSHPKSSNQKFPSPLGRHWLIELYDCVPSTLQKEETVEAAMCEAAHRAGATVVTSTFHQFAPQGVSGVVVIQESHLTIHTWPEYGYAALDLFTCGDTVRPEAAVDFLVETFSVGRWEMVEVERGKGGVMG